MKIEALRCSKCDLPLHVSPRDGERITCPGCGAENHFDWDSLQADATAAPDRFKPRSFISLGASGTYQAKAVEVIGRICKSASIREWDPEDSRYYTEPWDFDVWVLVDQDKKYLYLSEDAEGYSISEAFTPSNPEIPVTGAQQMTLFTEQPQQRVLEEATVTTEYFEGEFTWTPRRGALSKYFEYGHRGLTYSVEWSLAEDGQAIEEVEFFKTTPLSKLQVAEIFGEESVLEEERQKLAAAAQAKKWGKAFFAVGAFMALLLLVSFFQSGKLLASYKVPLDKIGEAGVIQGPIELKQTDSVYRIVISTSIPDNSWAWAAYEILDHEQAAINAVEGEFWRESGRDSDGPWSEQDTETDDYFRLSEAGKYYVRIFAEAGTARTGTVSVKVFEGITLSRYYFLVMLMCFGYGFAILRYKSLKPWYLIVGILALGFFILSNMGDD